MEIRMFHTIIPTENKYLYKVINNANGKIYEIDISEPRCSCPAWDYKRKNREGKKVCKHIKMVKGLKTSIGEKILPKK